MKGLSVKELSCGELYKLLEKGEFSGEPIILLVDEPERVETLPVTLKQNAGKIRHNSIIILITSEKKPEEISELSDITTFLSLSPLNKKEIRDICDRNFPKLKNRDALISFITERTNGIPLLINQTLRYLSDEGIIGRKGEEWVFKEEEARNIPFSPDIKELLKFQVENLLDDERNLLKVCSVFPNRIPQRFFLGLGIKNPYSIIESLVMKRLLVKNEGIIQFSNKWIQELLYQTLKKEEKKRIYQKIIKEEPITEPEILYPLQIELGMKKEALESLNQAIKERIKQRDYPAAIELLQKILSIRSDKQKRMVLARLLELVGRYKEALDLYEELLKGDPDNPCFLLRLGANQSRIGLNDQAEENLISAINKASGFYKQKAIYELGRLFLETHRPDDASRLLSESMIDKKEVIPELHYLAAHIAYLENKPDEVIRISGEVLKRNLSLPLKRAFLNFLGLAKQKKEEYANSIKYFDECLLIDRELRDRSIESIHLMNKGFSLLQLDQYRKAISDIESALSIFQSARMRDMEARAIWNLSVLYLRMGFWDKLEERIQQFEERYGDIDSLLKEGLVYIGMYRGDYADVERLILELKKEDESTDEFQALLSSYKGEWEIAEELFKKAIEEVKG
ncbi:tetratricopeptide repeat protein, partial [candidate division WOR-3 bacterium]|nr:tetratricopeptide repeat protein [candidate division WOR-3 bacterium]